MRPMLLVLVLTTACTTLGPNPATTGVSAIPTGRPGLEIQAGMMPAFHYSDAASADPPTQTATQQVSAVFEPDRLFGTKGLILGARSFGDNLDRPFEPMIGLRRRLDQKFALAGIAYGTRAHGESIGASYSATRVGGELAIDGTLIPGRWLALHVQASVSATYIDASGNYCVGETGYGVDCREDSVRVDGALEGVYGAATAGVSLDIARRPEGLVHHVRIAVLAAVGGMPHLRDGVQEPSSQAYRSVGLSLTLGFGSER